ncbi:MAG: hypothetical protein ACRERS_03615, partial [Methylococcales bacterium]
SRPDQPAMADPGTAQETDRLVALYRAQLAKHMDGHKGLEISDYEESTEPESQAAGESLRALVFDPLFPAE